MDVAKFEEWLSGMAVLTVPQRREAWRKLALSEASDGCAIENETASGADIPDVGRGAPRDELPMDRPIVFVSTAV